MNAPLRHRDVGPRLLVLDNRGWAIDRPRSDLSTLFEPGDLIVANDAATLPASLFGLHEPTRADIEVRLAGWVDAGDPTRFIAVLFGAGDHRTRTEHRPLPPPMEAGDRLVLGRLVARVEAIEGHPRLARLRFSGGHDAIFAGLAASGRPIQYAHRPDPLALWDMWTPFASRPFAFEPPSAGFALDWRMVDTWRRRGIGFATLTHAAGISSTGDPALDARLPLDEPYDIPDRTSQLIAETRATGKRVIAIGTTVVRALEAAAAKSGSVEVGGGVASGRITGDTKLRIVDAMLTGVHQPGESHFELLRAFADEAVLRHIAVAIIGRGYRTHEFGDSVLVERAK